MKPAVLLGVCAFLAASPRAAEHPYRIAPELDHAIQAGLHKLYNLNFDGALEDFKDLSPRATDHPMIAFGEASTHWWRLSVFVLEADRTESADFLSSVHACIHLSQEKIRSGDPTGEARLVLGGAYGLLGRWQATNRQWLSAYFNGRRAIRFLREALETNPDLKDAYMGLGIFDYYVARLPTVVRVLSFLGGEKDPEVGINQLKIAAEEGVYSRTPAQLFLIQILDLMEGRPEDALHISESLDVEFPESAFIPLLRMISLYNSGEIRQLAAEAEAFQERLKAGVYASVFAAQARFFLALPHFKIRDWDRALIHFHLATQAEPGPDPFQTWARLYEGYTLDAMGRRDAAVDAYRDVLGRLVRWGSHDAAKQRLRTPFRGTDEELAQLSL